MEIAGDPVLFGARMDDWYKESFSQDYLTVYRHRDVRDAETIVDGLLSYVQLPPRSLCLDLCCGFGRHLHQLQRKGIRTYGVDLSPVLLDYAAGHDHGRDRLIRADMRRLPFSPVFDFVFSFFSSFGYFSDDRENVRVFHEIKRALRPSGGFLIDYLNADSIRRQLLAEDQQQYAEYSLRQRRWIDDRLNMVAKEITVTDAAGARVYQERIKLYTLDQFREFFAVAGLRLLQVFGDADGSVYHADSPRLVMLGARC